MQASITIGGIEVALTISPGELESSVAERYAPFLGAVENPVCYLGLELPSGHADGRTAARQPWRPQIPVGRLSTFDSRGASRPLAIQVPVDPVSLDWAVGTVFGSLALDHNAFLLEGSMVPEDDGETVALRMMDREIDLERANGWPCPSLVLIRHMGGGWIASSTPFGSGPRKSPFPREGALRGFWSQTEAPLVRGTGSLTAHGILAQHVFQAIDGEPDRDLLFTLVERALSEVSFCTPTVLSTGRALLGPAS